MLVRGLFRRCAWCGGRGAFFTGWSSKVDRCTSCGLSWRRGDVGYELGALTMAFIMTAGPLMSVLGVVMVATWPDFNTVPLSITLGAGALLLPILLYPISYTTWQAIDILMRPVSADDFDLAAAFDTSDDRRPCQ